MIAYSPEGVPNNETDEYEPIASSPEPKIKNETEDSEPLSNGSALVVGPIDAILQSENCFETSINIPQCIECDKTPMTNKWECRFFEFRKLVRDKGVFKAVGFLDPAKDPSIFDRNLWTTPEKQLKVDRETCDYILSYIAIHFCELCEAELKISRRHTVGSAWKRSVIQVREICDVCETSVFNIHWTCEFCGTCVCPDCFQERQAEVRRCKPKTKSEKEERDAFFWLKCHRQKEHKMMLTQMTTCDSLMLLNQRLHEICDKRNITQTCGCSLRNKNCIKAQAKAILSEQSQDSLELRQIMKHQRYKTKKARARRLSLMESNHIYQSVKLTYVAQGRILKLMNPSETAEAYKIFQHHWEQGKPVIVANVTTNMRKFIWSPEYFSQRFGNEKHVMIDCKNSNAISRVAMKYFWDGFASVKKRLPRDVEEKLVLKLKDWPTSDDFADVMREHYEDFMKAAPLAAYTTRQGKFNLTRYLPSHFSRPDLGPKMYSAYSQMHPSKRGSTNLHLDVSDAINVMVYVSKPKDAHLAPDQYSIPSTLLALDQAGADEIDKTQLLAEKRLPGAIWHIFPADQADDIRKILHQVARENGNALGTNDDPIHDQNFYINNTIRGRLKENGIEGFTIVQYEGDAVFIPAGAPHQVLNVLDCIKVALDFVGPENLSECLNLTDEFRVLSTRHENREDKLQIKNILFHTIKNLIPTGENIT